MSVGFSETGRGFADASEVVHALDAVGFGLSFCKRRQQHAGENTNDGNHHQKLDEGKTLLCFFYDLISPSVELCVSACAQLKSTRSDTIN